MIPNGVRGKLIRQTVEREERHILFLGRLDVEQKGLDLLLDAAAGLVGKVDARLVIAGAGAPRHQGLGAAADRAPGTG